MSYQCIMYLNTGLNAVNIPDSPDLLKNCKQQTAQALEILNPIGLNNVLVKYSDQVNFLKIDYICLTENGRYYYYTVTGSPVFINTDTLSIPIEMDYINTAGGISNIHILDGITERVHTGSDNYGEFDIDDPLLAPQRPMHLACGFLDFSENGKIIPAIQCTIDPVGTYSGKSVTSYGTETNSKAVAKVDPIKKGEETVFRYAGTTAYSRDTGTALYNMNVSKVANSISNIRALGIESAIIRQVGYDDGLVSVHTESDGRISEVTSNTIEKNLRDICSKKASFSSFLFRYGGDYKKNPSLPFYSKWTKYGLLTCAGNSLEAEPFKLYNARYSSGDNYNTIAPSVIMKSDPHPDGKPYYRFLHMGDMDTSSIMLSAYKEASFFWKNAVAGLEWRNVPLRYDGASGSALTTQKFEATREIFNIQAAQLGANKSLIDLNNTLANQRIDYNAIGGTASGASTGIFGTLSSALSGNAVGAGQSLVSGTTQALMTAGQAENAKMQQQANYNAQLQQNTTNSRILSAQQNIAGMDYANSQNVYVPTLNFPYNTNPLRDIFNNGVIVYRYCYEMSDFKRICDLLKKYGYAYRTSFSSQYLNNRPYYNYVKASGISCYNDTYNSTWFNTGIANQLSRGVRLWHKALGAYNTIVNFSVDNEVADKE